MVGLKTVTYAKISPQMVNLRDVAGECRKRRKKNKPKQIEAKMNKRFVF